MAGEHDEVDPIKSNPNSHKAVGVALVVTVLVGLGYWLRGSPFSTCAISSAGDAVPTAACCPVADQNDGSGTDNAGAAAVERAED